MDMSFSTKGALFSNTYKTNRQDSYSAFFQNKIDNGDSATAHRKPRNTSSVTVSSYVDKNGNVHKTYTGQSTDVVESMKKYADKNANKDKAKIKKHLQYSYQKVSNQVIMAKNSMSASKAVLAATRSLSELKRKIKASDCSEDEKEAALAHANRMLRIAKKKKRNLEMEELIKVSLREDGSGGEQTEFIKDEKPERKPFDISQLYMDSEGNPDGETKDNSAETNDMPTDLMDLDYEPSDIDLDDELSDMNISEDMEELNDDLEALTEDMADMISEAFKDLMDLLEVINPHMDEEHFEKLKTKHRQDEQKEIVKADMEYLKAYIKAVQEENGSPINTSSPNDFANYNMMTADINTILPSENIETSIGFSANA